MGCMYQTYKISLLYFSYETTTNVKYESNHAEITYSGITLCIFKHSIYQDNLYNLTSSIRSTIQKFNEYSISRQFAFLRSPESFYSSIVFGTHGSDLNSLSHIKSMESIDIRYYCLNYLLKPMSIK